ncbi:MAG: AAA family ATPase [Butyricicoccus sp.]|nr:AAA family ATPase [Butyricicoccus sp.]
MEKTVAIMIGIQGSGKSTFYHRFLAEEYVRVNLDTLKTRAREWALVEECMRAGKSFAVDNTNPAEADRARYILPAKEAGYKVIGFFMESRLQPCLERNAKREGKERIPEKAIAATSNRLQLPRLEEGFDELYFVKNDGQTMTISEWREMG